MDEQKIKRVVAASVVIAVFLLTVLLSFMVYQMIAISAKKKQLDTLNEQIAELEKERDRMEDQIDTWLSNWKIEERARELDWYYPSDK